jgi:hypothetical protein
MVVKCGYAVVVVGVLMWYGGIGNSTAFAQKYNYVDREQLADTVFPPLAPAPGGAAYDTQLTLRFSNPDSEIVIATHGRGTKTVVLYRLASRATLGEAIAQALRLNPRATLQEIAAGIQIERIAVSILPDHVDQWLRGLQSLAIPLELSLWVKADGVPEYDLWVDTNGDTSRYHFSYAPTRGAQEHPFAALAHWMETIRSEVEPEPPHKK